jgi:hypothetical protein
MAKKSFKGGLGSLIQNTRIVDEKPDIEKPASQKEVSAEHSEWLKIKISRLEDELKLWRTGKLVPEIFKKSLKKYGLKYDEKQNAIVDI